MEEKPFSDSLGTGKKIGRVRQVTRHPRVTQAACLEAGGWQLGLSPGSSIPSFPRGSPELQGQAGTWLG